MLEQLEMNIKYLNCMAPHIVHRHRNIVCIFCFIRLLVGLVIAQLNKQNTIRVNWRYQVQFNWTIWILYDGMQCDKFLFIEWNEPYTFRCEIYWVEDSDKKKVRNEQKGKR